ncbi:MAG: FMN-binding glutamate synthase family protein, partial [Candidatus Hodarchaeota archaeon]
YNGRKIPPSAIGVYTYFVSKLGTGLKQLLAGARKFKIDLIDRQDIAYISQRAKEICKKWSLGIKSQESLDFDLVKEEIHSGNY